MRKFSSLFLAAVLGSVCTVASFQFLDEDQEKVKVEYVANTPATKVAYKVDANGKAVPLDFTAAAEKVMPAVVHIRSSQDGARTEQTQTYDPFREFFGPRYPQQQGPSQSAGSGVII